MLCAPPIFDFSDTTKQFQKPIHVGLEHHFSWYSKFDSISVSAPCGGIFLVFTWFDEDYLKKDFGFVRCQ